MDKLVEREPAARNPLVAAPALAVQFFLIPLAVVAITVSVYVGFRSLLADNRGPKDYLAEVQNGGSDRRWSAPSSAPKRTIREFADIWRSPSAASIRRCPTRQSRRSAPRSMKSRGRRA